MPKRTQLLYSMALAVLLATTASAGPAPAKKKSNQPEAVEAAHPEDALQALEWRLVGPYRGGRSAAVAGIPQDRETYYFGGAGGGVWKTTDGGTSW